MKRLTVAALTALWLLLSITAVACVPTKDATPTTGGDYEDPAQNNGQSADQGNGQNTDGAETGEDTMWLIIGETKLKATLCDNAAARALKASLPLTIEMSDYGNFEKVGTLGTRLPQDDRTIATQAGDLILYQGNHFVIYYDTNRWSLTRLGRIDNVTQSELKAILGEGDVTVTLTDTP